MQRVSQMIPIHPTKVVVSKPVVAPPLPAAGITAQRHLIELGGSAASKIRRK